jgi:hypothetical protein
LKKKIKYEQHEFTWPHPIKREATLAEFILDIPFILFNGVIPPLHLLNEILSSGDASGGMSPGTSWKPFEISKEEYNELVAELLALDLDALKKEDRIRFIPEKIIADESLHDSPVFFLWLQRVKKKYK